MTVNATREGIRAERVLVPMAQGARHIARLSFDNGVERVDLRTGDDPDALLAAEFGEPIPVVRAADFDIHIEYPLGARFLRRVRATSVWINPAVPWTFDVHGGASQLGAHLTDVDVRGIGLHAGAAHVHLALGEPSGTCVIQVASVKDLRIERPAGVPVRLDIAKGAVHVALDDRRFGAVGELNDHSAGYAADVPHYHVTVTGGADTIAIAEAR